ncbi:MAG: zinc ribbon domain-containing protein [Thermoplasmata archaeon]|jgi:ribosomal protein L40E
MQYRFLLTLVNLVLLGVALAIYFLVPSLSTIAFYGLLLWMFVSLALAYHPRTSGRIGAGAPRLGTAPSGSGAPLASSGAAPLGFCIWCGTAYPPGATQCPACGRSAPTAWGAGH